MQTLKPFLYLKFLRKMYKKRNSCLTVVQLDSAQNCSRKFLLRKHELKSDYKAVCREGNFPNLFSNLYSSVFHLMGGRQVAFKHNRHRHTQSLKLTLWSRNRLGKSCGALNKENINQRRRQTFPFLKTCDTYFGFLFSINKCNHYLITGF